MINDRGIKKWQGFMMLEHIRSLKNLEIETQKIQMPILDDYQLQDFEVRIHFSMENHLPVEFKLFIDGFEETIAGYVHYVDHLKKQFNMKNMKGQVEYIRFKDIMDVKLID